MAVLSSFKLLVIPGNKKCCFKLSILTMMNNKSLYVFSFGTDWHNSQKSYSYTWQIVFRYFYFLIFLGILRDILRRVQRVEQNIVNLTARTQNDDVRDVVEIETLNELSKLDEFENKLNDITFFSTVVSNFMVFVDSMKIIIF